MVHLKLVFLQVVVHLSVHLHVLQRAFSPLPRVYLLSIRYSRLEEEYERKKDKVMCLTYVLGQSELLLGVEAIRL